LYAVISIKLDLLPANTNNIATDLSVNGQGVIFRILGGKGGGIEDGEEWRMVSRGIVLTIRSIGIEDANYRIATAAL